LWFEKFFLHLFLSTTNCKKITKKLRKTSRLVIVSGMGAGNVLLSSKARSFQTDAMVNVRKKQRFLKYPDFDRKSNSHHNVFKKTQRFASVKMMLLAKDY
jgi:hypothetical protein